MATSIAFTDATGAATLTNGKPVPADRFDSWEPFPVQTGPTRQSPWTGVRYRYGYGTFYGARFQLSKIPRTSQATAQRLIEHLVGGGTCTVNTGDASSTSYATCGLAPDFEPTLVMSDNKHIEYTLSLAVINLAVSPVRMVCVYA